jgi:hypothetical protein
LCILRVQQDEKGRIPTGSRRRKLGPDGEPITHKVLPIRVPADPVPTLDEAWKRLDIAYRSEFIRRAAHEILEKAGETEAASVFAADE